MALFGNQPQQQPQAAPALAVPQGGGTATDFAGRFNAIQLRAAKGEGSEASVDAANLILEEAVNQGTSDVHIELGGGQLRVRFRIDGQLTDALKTQIHPQLPVTQRFRILAGFDPKPGGTFRSEDGRFTVDLGGRSIQSRCSVFPTVDGESVVLRIFDQTQLGLGIEQVGMPSDTLDMVNKLVKCNYGMFVVTGATGCGKTTTLYGILQKLNQPNVNIMSLEDPVEYRLAGINQAQINPKMGFTFAEALRGVLRQDPNVVMVGEIRDAESAEIAMRTAQTGHFVLTSLHTISAPGAVDRLFEMGVQPFLMTSSLLGVLAQRLIRRLCECAKPTTPPPQQVVDEFAKTLDPEEGSRVKELIYRQGATFLAPTGCDKCRGTGYLGRTGLFELMVMNEHLRGHILAKSAPDLIRRTAIQTGMRTLLMDGVLKASSGWTTLDEVLRVTAVMA
jgi:type IV pilus assembly protein PilB